VSLPRPPAGDAPVALTIAGSDPGGGAGLQADLVTFAAFGVRGTTVVTALTAQTPRGVQGIVAVDPSFVAAQLDAVLATAVVRAVKTGMLHRAAVVEMLAGRLAAAPPPHLVVDPVMHATAGGVLLDADGVAALRTRLLPLATLVTPNLAEAEALTGRPVRTVADMREAATALCALGARAALVTGGHRPGDAVDVLHDGTALHELRAPRVPVATTHGTGCTLSAAVAAGLARGAALHDAVAAAKAYVTSVLGAAGRAG
jgi:hydroxymethylpyrimidine/phosphomethylpyrimidine kinase